MHPLSEACGVVADAKQHGASAVDEHASQIGAAALADAQQLLVSSGGVLSRQLSRSRTEPKTTTYESCLNGGKRIVRAVPNRLDDMMFEFVQHGKLLVQRSYHFWISECGITARATAFNCIIERWAKN